MTNAIDSLRHLIDSYGWRDNGDLQDFIDAADTIDMQYVELPKDADGVPIRVGDMMDGTCPSGKHVNGNVKAIGDGVFWLSNVQFSLKPDYMHHYHEPTVEDMLWDLLGNIRPDMEDEEAVPIVKACAEKLRLADEGEE